MRRVNIRDLNGDFFEEVARANEPVGITNNRRLCAVLLPVTPEWVDQIIVDNLSRIRHSIERGLKADPPRTTVDATTANEPGEAELPIIRRVKIRELRGSLIEKAAASRETLGVMNDGRLCAVLIPVTAQWVDKLIDHSVSRIVHSVDQGEKALEGGQDLVSLDEIFGAPRHRLTST